MRTKIEGKVSPIIWIFIIVFGLLFLASCSSKYHSKERSPKAKFIEPKGNHIENLAAHEVVSIKSIGSVEGLQALPLWINHSINEPNPSIYDGIFWEIEPWGEYLYFLAGDYKKNEKGLLRFPSPTTSARVEISFEDDVIRVAKLDGTREQARAENNQLELDKIKDLRLINIEKISSNLTSIDGAYVGNISLGDILPKGAVGSGRLSFIKLPNRVDLTIVYEEFIEPKRINEFERYLKILVQSKDPSLSIEDALKIYSELIAKYSDMPYTHVSGSTRM